MQQGDDIQLAGQFVDSGWDRRRRRRLPEPLGILGGTTPATSLQTFISYLLYMPIFHIIVT